MVRFLLICIATGFVLLLISCTTVLSNDSDTQYDDEYLDVDGGFPPPQLKPEDFVPNSRFSIQNYHIMMTELYHQEFEPYGGVIAIEIYEETLLALLNEPEVSIIARYEASMDSMYRPLAVSLLRPIINEYGEWVVFFGSRDEHVVRGPHGHGFIRRGFRANMGFLVVPPHIVRFSDRENVINFLAENGIDAEVIEINLLLFDDPFHRFMPSHFLWVNTDAGAYFIWMVNPEGPFAVSSDDFIRRLYTPEDFRDNWRTLMDRDTMRDNH